MEITESPSEDEVQFIQQQVRGHNFTFLPNDRRSLAVFERDETGNIIAGLTATTYWERLDIHFLWVCQKHRNKGLATNLLQMAEREALSRGCRISQVDTFSFQALPLYQKLGYTVFGSTGNFPDAHIRYYLSKIILET